MSRGLDPTPLANHLQPSIGDFQLAPPIRSEQAFLDQGFLEQFGVRRCPPGRISQNNPFTGEKCPRVEAQDLQFIREHRRRARDSG